RRLAAIDAAKARLATEPSQRSSAPELAQPDEREDFEVALLAREYASRLVRGPMVAVDVDGDEHRFVLGREVTIGRRGASISLASQLISRQHLLVRQVGATAVVEDLGSHNGTLVGGVPLSGPIPIGSGVRLELAGHVPCWISPLTSLADT